MAGLPAAASDINRVCGNAVLQLAQALSQCSGLNTMLNDTTRGFGSANLAAMYQAAGESAGQATTDAGLLISSFADLQNLFAVAHGQQAQAAPSDFFFHAKLLMGTVPLQ
jgi:hypothetical protein